MVKAIRTTVGETNLSNPLNHSPTRKHPLRTGLLALSGGAPHPDTHSNSHTHLPPSATSTSTSEKHKLTRQLSKSTATWRAGPSHSLEYETEVSSYKNPLSAPASQQKFAHCDGFETARDKLRQVSLQKFQELAKKKYGSVQHLLTAFKKGSEDTISLDEFSEELRKRMIDLHFPRDQQRLLFEYFDTKHVSVIPIKDVLNHFQDDLNNGCAPVFNVNERHVQRQLIEEIRTAVTEKIEQARHREKLVISPRQSKKQLAHTLRILDPHSTGLISIEKLKWALGPDYLDLRLTPEQTDEIIKLCPTDRIKKDHVSYDKFVKILGIRDSNNAASSTAITDAFFDERANQVTRLKQRIASLNNLANDSELLSRRMELLKVCKMGPESLRPMTANDGLTKTSSEDLVFTRLDSGNDGVKIDVDTTHPVAFQNNNEGESNKRHFRLTEQPPSMTKLKNPTAVEIVHVEKKERRKEGKKRFAQPATDWNRIGFGGSTCDLTLNTLVDDTLAPLTMNTTTSNYLSKSISEKGFATMTDHYKTMNASYYSPLKYEPSKPVRRPNIISDSERAFLQKTERRRKRQERTQKTLESFKNFEELDKISRVLNSAARERDRVEEMLMYETSAMIKDMKTFARRPIFVMQRKSHDELFNKMWSGTGNLASSEQSVDDRDFQTTYEQSYKINVPEETAC